MEKTLINVRILQDSLHIGVPWQRSIVECKIFSFKIPWRLLKPHGYQGINVIEARGVFLVVSHSNRSVPSSFVPLSLYIYMRFLPSHFHFSQQIFNQSALICLIDFAFCLLRASVRHTLQFFSIGKYFYVEFPGYLFKFWTSVVYVKPLGS